MFAGHFGSVENRRKFFMDFAEKKAFDPYVLSNWTSYAIREVKREKVHIFISNNERRKDC